MNIFRIVVHLKSALKDFLKGKSFQERDEILFQVNLTDSKKNTTPTISERLISSNTHQKSAAKG